MTSLLELRAVDDGFVVVGAACLNGCDRSARPLRRCAECGAAAATATFGPAGTVWATTFVHVPAGDRPSGRRLAFVDLDDGPRIVAELRDDVPIGSTVRLADRTALGDPIAVAA